MTRSLGIQLICLVFFGVAHGFPFPTRQVPFRSSVYTNIDFQEPENGLKSLQVPLSLMAAAPQLDFSNGGSEKSICSSTVVSDDGKLLTASHCLETCAREAGLLKQERGYWAVDTKLLPRMNCTVKINGVGTEFKVLAMAPCIQQGIEYLYPDYSTNCKSLDYAILQPAQDRVPSAPCLRISRNQTSIGADVLALGYPLRTFRSAFKKGERDVNGRSLELTSGKILPPQGKCFVDVDEKNKGGDLAKRGDKSFPNQERTTAVLSEVRLGHLVQTSVDVLPGMSGASLVNASTGEVHGIGMFAEGNGEWAFCSGGGFFSSSTNMLEDLKENFPDLDIEKTLKCESRAVFPKSKRNQNSQNPGEAPVVQEGVR